jgi:intracellular septation protein
MLTFGYDTRMSQLLELAPLAIFLIAYKLWGIYAATAALMAACVVVLIVHRLRTGRFKTMHVITAGVVVGLGTLTLLLHDARFIQWKPTVLLGLGAGAFVFSMVIGPRPLVQRMFEGVFPEPLEVSSRAWMLINTLWALWFAALALLNIYIARNFSEGTWVNFKVYGITPATLLFMIPQVIWLSNKIRPEAASPPSTSASAAGPADREQRLRQRLESNFAPTQLVIEDESDLHAGHAGAAEGHGHFRIRIVAEAFRGVPSVARHRLVYAAVGDLMQTDIHALTIEALPPE